MEGEQHHYELRSRSRSRSHTPMIFNIIDSEQSEHHYDLRSRESRERSHTPAEVSSSRRSNSRSLPNSAHKSKDTSMEPISEKKEESQVDLFSDNQNNHEDCLPPTTKKVERRSERVRVKRHILTNGQGDLQDNALSIERTEQKSKSLTPKRTSDYSSDDGEKEDPPSRPGSAYEIYKQAGDWWNVFPKTDYTYSQASQCRYEIAPGVLAMPNMSRPSIHSDGSSVGSSHSLSQQTLSQTSHSAQERYNNTNFFDCGISDTIEQNRLNEENARILSGSMTENSGSRFVYKQTYVEKYTQHRGFFFGDSNITRNRFGSYNQVDSDADLDEAITLKSSSYDEKWRITKWCQKLMSVVVMIFVGIFQFINSKILRRNSVASHTPVSYHRYQESTWTKLWKPIDHVLQYFYLLLIRILYLDSWMVSRVSNVRENFLARRSRVFWLILLPPLLLAGAYIAQKHTLTSMDTLQNVQNGFTETTNRIYNDVANLNFFDDYGFVAKYLTNFQNISLPSMPNINVTFPTIKDIGWNITW